MTDEIGALVRERRPHCITEWRRLRIEAGLRLVDIADRVGVTGPTIWHWERGTFRPRGERGAKYIAVMNAIREALADAPERT